jgi:hypothetical protein
VLCYNTQPRTSVEYAVFMVGTDNHQKTVRVAVLADRSVGHPHSGCGEARRLPRECPTWRPYSTGIWAG